MELTTGDRSRVDARMQLGTVQESLVVTGESPLLQTDSSTVSSLINEKTVQDAPIPGRNIIRMVQMIPGASEGALSSLANGTRPDERRQTSSVSINGVNDVLNNQLVDGMDNNERTIGTVSIKPSIDAIAEVRVQTNMYTAETGRTLGGVINIITKSGGNAFHGSGFEFARHEKFDSRLFFATDKPITRLNQFGGSLGGPLAANRTFFFVDYEGYRLKQGVPTVITVPTVKMRNGDFSELATPIYDPTTAVRAAFPGNQIPLSRFDPIAPQDGAAVSVADEPRPLEQLRVHEWADAEQSCDRRAHRPPLQQSGQRLRAVLGTTRPTRSRPASVRLLTSVDDRSIRRASSAARPPAITRAPTTRPRTTWWAAGFASSTRR